MGGNDSLRWTVPTVDGSEPTKATLSFRGLPLTQSGYLPTWRVALSILRQKSAWVGLLLAMSRSYTIELGVCKIFALEVGTRLNLHSEWRGLARPG